MGIDKDLDKLIDNLPFFIQENINSHKKKNQITEIVIDLGRRPEIRFPNGPEYLSKKIISWQDIDYTTKRISKFTNDNRAGIERTLHRISCIRNRQSIINGLTCRVGRSIFGAITIVRDLLETDQSILILGRPGVGKTTIIREIARVLSDEMQKRVIIIDTSNEIAGNSDIPHIGIGRARRMQVPKTELQHQIMIEAVENHMPEVIIIDEIGTELEALAARTIAEKGVQLVGTTHGNCLENLIKNPPLSDLIGGVQYVTLSDEEAKRRGSQKSILERKAYPAFQAAIEINQQNAWTIYENIKESIDSSLKGSDIIVQVRQFNTKTKTTIKHKKSISNFYSTSSRNWNTKSIRNLDKHNYNISKYYNRFQFPKSKSDRLLIYVYSISNNLIKETIAKTGISLRLTTEIKKADYIFGLKKHLKLNFKLRKISTRYNIPMYTISRNNVYQLTKLIQFLR
jgi:stage III sporulation protein SpoIIIAA